MVKNWKYILIGVGALAAAFFYMRSGNTRTAEENSFLFLQESGAEKALQAEQNGEAGNGSETSPSSGSAAEAEGFTETQKQQLQELLHEAIQAELSEEIEQYIAAALKTNLDSMMENGRLPEAVADYQAVQSTLVNINTADAKELTRLPGIGEAKAQAILSYREEHGAFSSVDELTEISGISSKTVERFRSQVTL